MNFSCNQQLISLNYEISCEKKIRPLAYHKKKFRTREKKSLNPQNTHEKKSDPRKMHEKKIRINETPTRKKFDLRNTHEKKNSDPHNTHKGTMAPWH